jgi:hypothetical protein
MPKIAEALQRRRLRPQDHRITGSPQSYGRPLAITQRGSASDRLPA